MVKYIIGVIPVIILVWIFAQVVNMSPADNCMKVYLESCQAQGTCTGILYTYPDGAGHIEHIATAWPDENVSGIALGCHMKDQDLLNSLINSIYCKMVQLYYF